MSNAPLLVRNFLRNWRGEDSVSIVSNIIKHLRFQHSRAYFRAGGTQGYVRIQRQYHVMYMTLGDSYRSPHSSREFRLSSNPKTSIVGLLIDCVNMILHIYETSGLPVSMETLRGDAKRYLPRVGTYRGPNFCFWGATTINH